MHNRLRILPILFLLLLLGAAGWYYFFRPAQTEVDSALKASGTVETVEMSVSPEIAGRITEVLVSEGDQVRAGDVLLRLDGALLTAQQVQAQTSLEAARAGLDLANTGLASAQAALNTAQVQYDIELNLARQQAQPARSAAWEGSLPGEFDLPVWYFTHPEELRAAQAELDEAQRGLETEQTSYAALLSAGASASLLQAEARLAQAQTAFLVAQDVLERAGRQSNTALRDTAQASFDAAQAELEAAQLEYDQTLSTQEAEDVLIGRARLAVAQERRDAAQDRYNSLLTGEDSLRVRAAAAALAQAESSLSQAQARVTQADSAIAQAQAQLSLVAVQMEKLVVYAAADGVVLSRNVQPGEVVQPGSAALTLGQLERLTITVYIPEDRYGEISVGQYAQVTVDSFPAVSFSARVVRIADQAEFTPRNVQTEEGRRTTVFAVELAVDDPSGRLKPGMPADVTFDQP